MPRKPVFTEEDFADKANILYYKKQIAIAKYEISKKQRRIKTLEKYIDQATPEKERN